MKTSFYNIVKPLMFISAIALILVACDEDFVNIESDIRGAQNFNTGSKLFPFVSYNKKVGPIQTNNLSNKVLGIYNDPNYGSTSANLITQITPTTTAPNFGDNTEILSVKLYIPYFYTLLETDADGNSTYELDSVYGDASSPYKLSIFRSNYYLRDLDPESDFENSQAYYSNAYTSLNLANFEGDLFYENNEFTPSESQIIVQEVPIDGTEEEELEKRTPGLYIDLAESISEIGIDYWQDFLLEDDGSANPVLTDLADFKNAFRGLIFKVEQDNMSNDGSMIFLNMNNAKIDVRFEKDGTVEDQRLRETYTFNFNSIKFNTLENLSNFQAITDGDNQNGDDQLHLKGFEGSMTVLDLFNGNIIDENNNTQDALQYFKDREGKWLINEANLNFYVDYTSQGLQTRGGAEPDRIMLYDLKNNTPIVDYFTDPTTNSSDPLNSKIIYAPKLERDEDENGVKYKIRLTEHIKRILLNDSTNVKLGLYVTSNINLFGTSKIQSALEDDVVRFVPQSSTISPEGTILHGSTPNVPENVRATFEIFYTEPNN
ncbi:DUF4270 domain-containing protein [Olleya aquimaris]|uniref:Uncharacterized protein DUF4270 n=1 Tax=Olleya aquimaris TaxID=639310 RepID=A0A327R5M4_9FLAO|nr:DUF4270 domain-containing protein [Olleya aquimaris]RAJ12139.1 uncharacterized protein DUF4270 [Olleya aquimaris]